MAWLYVSSFQCDVYPKSLYEGLTLYKCGSCALVIVPDHALVYDNSYVSTIDVFYYVSLT
jgi:hypothetical protein